MTTGQFAIANQATMSWTDTNSSQVISTVGFRSAAWTESVEVFKTVPTLYLMVRRTLGIADAMCALGGMFDASGATPSVIGTGGTIPTQPGTLVVTFATGKTKTCLGFIVKLEWSVTGGGIGGEQEYTHLFLASAAGPTDKITTA